MSAVYIGAYLRKKFQLFFINRFSDNFSSVRHGPYYIINKMYTFFFAYALTEIIICFWNTVHFNVFLLFVPKTPSFTTNILGDIFLFHARLSAQRPQTHTLDRTATGTSAQYTASYWNLSYRKTTEYYVLISQAKSLTSKQSRISVTHIQLQSWSGGAMRNFCICFHVNVTELPQMKYKVAAPVYELRPPIE
jgi:hypothetical protein